MQTYVPLVARCFSAYRWKLRELDRQASFMRFICRQLKDFTNSVKKHHSHMLVCALSFYQVITHSIVKVWQQSNKKKYIYQFSNNFCLIFIFGPLQLAYPKFMETANNSPDTADKVMSNISLHNSNQVFC